MARSRPRRRLLALLGLLVALAVIERASHSLRARYLLPTYGAEWIWASESAGSSAPVVFYAVRDFELPPNGGSTRLRILGVEEYLVAVNGKRVGSGSFSPGSAVDEYELNGLLVPGWNRLLVELRSARGAGGLLLALLIDGDPGPVVKSDDSWRLFRRHLPGLAQGWRPLEDGERPQVWGSPPTGRWGVSAESEARPSLAAATLGEPEVVEAVSIERLPALYCSPLCSEPLHRLAARLGGGGYLIDFGRPLVGYLELELADGPPFARSLESGLNREALVAGEGEDGTVLLMPERRGWRDARVRRLRYAVVSGREELHAARLHRAEAAPAPPRIAAQDERSRLFGIPPPQNSVTGSNSTTSWRVPSRKR